MRTLSVMTCVRSVESGTGSGPMPAMKMLNVDRTEGNIGVHSPLFITFFAINNLAETTTQNDKIVLWAYQK